MQTTLSRSVVNLLILFAASSFVIVISIKLTHKNMNRVFPLHKTVSSQLIKQIHLNRQLLHSTPKSNICYPLSVNKTVLSAFLLSTHFYQAVLSSSFSENCGPGINFPLYSHTFKMSLRSNSLISLDWPT